MRITRTTGRKNVKAIFPLIAALSASVTALALFGGCSVTPIFATIETEISLATPTVLGRVSELFWAQPGTAQELFLANGKLKRKTATSNSWTDVSLPSGGLRVMNIATNALNGTGSLYALFANESDWGVFNSVQQYNGTGWVTVNIPAGTSVDWIGSGNGRVYAFVRTGQSGSSFVYSIYAITGTTFPATALVTGVSKPLASSGDYLVSSDTVYHFNGSGLDTVTITGKTGTNVSVTTDVSGNPYILSTGGVYDFTGGTWTAHTYSITSPAQSISILDTATTDFILVSGLAGYCEITGTVGGSWSNASQVPGSAAPSSIATTSNAQYTSSLALYSVSGIFGVTNHTPSGDTYAIYASVRDDTFDGLWGYYPETRANWNRES
jgi:hypothetical protein